MTNQTFLQDKTTLILGSTGKTGRRVVQRFQAAGLPYREGTRQAALPFDWQQPEQWDAVLQGIEQVYLVFYPDLALPGAADCIRGFLARAEAAGVRKIVMLSGRGEPEAEACEALLQQSALTWTIVRASWFNQNFSESFLWEAVQERHVLLPIGDVLEPFVDLEDVADVVFAALTENGHGGQCYEVTGPECLSFAQAVQIIAEVSGEALQYTQIPLADYLAFARQAQVPEPMLQLLSYLFTEVLDGRNSYITAGIQQALGRPATDFRTYVKRVAQTQGWFKRPAIAGVSGE